MNINITELWEEDYKIKSSRRYQFLLSKLLDSFINKNVLDVGAGPFHFSALLKKNGCNVKSLDINPSRFKDYIKKNNLNVSKCNIEKNKYPYSNNTFHCVLLAEVIEHLYINPFFCLKEIHRILKKNGKLFLFTDNLYSLKTIKSFVTGQSINDALKIWRKLEDLGHRGHIRLYSKTELFNILDFCGFKIVSHEYVHYDGKYKKLIYKVAPKMFYPHQYIVAEPK